MKVVKKEEILLDFSLEELNKLRTAREVIEEAVSLISEANGVTNDDPMPAYRHEGHGEYVAACWSVLELLEKIEAHETI